MKRKLRYGMIGGGRGAFIGGVHRIAAAMDGQAELVAGAFSSDAERSKLSGEDLFLDPTRVYGSYVEMAREEAKMPAQHFPPAKLFLEKGFNVICDKPVTFNLKEALKLRSIVSKTKQVFVLTHNYTGNPMVREARQLVKSGSLGKIRKIIVEYPQGWLATALEKTKQKQASWRVDPKKSGAAGAMGDIGTHAENLARYVTGLRLKEICADLTTFVPGRKLDDDGSILLRYHGGAKGVLHASQICVGEENALTIRVYGEKGGLEWHQENPNALIVKHLDKPREVFLRGNGYLSDAAKHVTRIPTGHPEGYLEAFGNIYREAFRAIEAQVSGKKIPSDVDYPTIEDGVEGMVFIETAVKSSTLGAKWVKFPQP